MPLTSTPTVSSPMSELAGVRPVATTSSSTAIVRLPKLHRDLAAVHPALAGGLPGRPGDPVDRGAEHHLHPVVEEGVGDQLTGERLVAGQQARAPTR